MRENDRTFLGWQPHQVYLVQLGGRPEGEQAVAVRRPIPEEEAALQRGWTAACDRGLYQHRAFSILGGRIHNVFSVRRNHGTVSNLAEHRDALIRFARPIVDPDVTHAR